MDLIESLPLIGPFLSLALPFLLVLSIVVFVHEYGHYIVGRWCGIHAETFSIGFGKRIASWTDSRGTIWQVAILPLGGFVKFTGDMDPASATRVEDDGLSPEEREKAFHTAALWRRAATVAAGPIFNFILSIVIFAGLAVWTGQGSSDPVIGSIAEDARPDIGLQAGDRVTAVDGEPVETFGDILARLDPTNGAPTAVSVERNGDLRTVEVRYTRTPMVTEVVPGGAASRAGMAPGDIVHTVAGQPIGSFRDLQLLTVDLKPGETVPVEVRRRDKIILLEVAPEMMSRVHPETGETVPLPTFGVMGSSLGGLIPLTEPVGPITAVTVGVERVGGIITGTVTYLSDMIFRGGDTSQLGGPIRIAQVSGDAADRGAASLIWLVAVLSTSIGLINLFPIPVLDGGHLMFYAIEALRGQPLAEPWMRVGTMIGLSLVVLLMVFATYNDLSQL